MDFKYFVTHSFHGFQLNSLKLTVISKTNIECNNSDHNLLYSAYDKEFDDQERCEILFHSWKRQTIISKDILKDN